MNVPMCLSQATQFFNFLKEIDLYTKILLDNVFLSI